jgi:hypothetical protein
MRRVSLRWNLYDETVDVDVDFNFHVDADVFIWQSRRWLSFGAIWLLRQ